MATTNDESIVTLMSMGFSRDQSSQALIECGGNVENAINLLLSGGNTSNTNNDTAQHHNTNDSSSVQAVHSDISQYSDSLGRSACTMIALSMAYKYLSNTNNNNPQSIISSTFLSDSIQEGIQLYNSIRNNENGVEHTSVEELISACLAAGESYAKSIIKSLKLLDSSPRQGILSNQSDNQLGLEAVLSQCQTDAIDSHSYIAVVITKSPETILVLLPPASASFSYILLDSHPRSQQLAGGGGGGSYALLHPSLSSLVESIKQIFPVTDLGDGVSEMMSMMYNSFDVYPFQLRRG
jgi:hypothetical protein